MVGWSAVAVLVVAAVIGAVFLFRSLKRWTPGPPTDAEGKQAEARLWSTRNMDQR
jgi:hypothetical protein